MRGAIKFAPNKTTGVSPFKMLHGFEAWLPIDTLLPVKEREMEAERQDTAAARAMVLGQEMEQIWQHVQKRREKMQEAIKKQKGRTPAGPELVVGRKVLLEVKRPLFAGGSTKLHERWQGPYEVVEKRGDLNRVVKGVNNPEDCPLVHVERLKPFIERKEEGSHKEKKKDKRAEDESDEEDVPRLRRRRQKANSRSRRSCRSGRRTARWSTSSGGRASRSAATPGPRPRACMQMNYYRGSIVGQKRCGGRR